MKTNEIDNLSRSLEKLSNNLEQLLENCDKTNAAVERLVNQNEKLGAEINNVKDIISSTSRGLGNNLETFNSQWIQKYLSLVHPTIQIETNAFFKDQESLVNETSDIFKVDIFSSSPLLICECTTFLEEDEFSKIEKLIRIRNFFEKQGKIVEYTYFATYDIANEIEDQVHNFCNANNIILIKKTSF